MLKVLFYLYLLSALGMCYTNTCGILFNVYNLRAIIQSEHLTCKISIGLFLLMLNGDCVRLQIWQCGGSIVWVPCSRVGHVYRGFMPYSFGELAKKKKGPLITIVSTRIRSGITRLTCEVQNIPI